MLVEIEAVLVGRFIRKILKQEEFAGIFLNKESFRFESLKIVSHLPMVLFQQLRLVLSRSNQVKIFVEFLIFNFRCILVT